MHPGALVGLARPADEKGVSVQDAQDQADRWRLRAEEIRRIADSMTRSSAKWALLDLADQWDEMASRAEVRARRRDPSLRTRAPGTSSRH